MLATVLISIIAIGTMAYSTYTNRNIFEQGLARLALIRATRQMELVKSTVYESYLSSEDGITVTANTDTFLSYDTFTGVFTRYTSDPSKTVTLSGRTCPIITKVRLLSTGSSSTYSENNYLEITTEVQYANIGESSVKSVYLKSRHSYFDTDA